MTDEDRSSGFPAFLRATSDRSLSAISGRNYSTLTDELPIATVINAATSDPREHERFVRAATMIAAVWRSFVACRRLQLTLIESFQPEAFRLKNGEAAEHGQVAFETHSAREPARYIRLSDESDIDKVVGLVRTVWGVNDAQVVISLTGGAQDLKLKPHVHEVFNRGLVRAAQQTNAWIVTGGTDTGVMKLVGEAVRDYQADVPCIGVATWGVVHGREQLAGNHGGDEFYFKAKANDANGASLEVSQQSQQDGWLCLRRPALAHASRPLPGLRATPAAASPTTATFCWSTRARRAARRGAARSISALALSRYTASVSRCR